jgi:hypothetical protein
MSVANKYYLSYYIYLFKSIHPTFWLYFPYTPTPVLPLYCTQTDAFQLLPIRNYPQPNIPNSYTPYTH